MLGGGTKSVLSASLAGLRVVESLLEQRCDWCNRQDNPKTGLNSPLELDRNWMVSRLQG